MNWRFQANRNLLVKKAHNSYRFWVSVPSEHSFNPQKYQQLLKQAPGRSHEFTRIPLSSDCHMWGFLDLESLNAFCDDIRNSQSSVDDG